MESRYEIETLPRKRPDGRWEARAKLFVYAPGGPPVQHAVTADDQSFDTEGEARSAGRRLAEELYRTRHGR